MAPIVKNYAARITRKLKKPDERGRDWVEDNIVNEIAFIEGDCYNNKIEDLVEEFKKIPLPKDIMVELVHNWKGSLPKGCPWGITSSLSKSGYVHPGNATGWFSYEGDLAVSQKFYVQCSDDLSYFAFKLWNESSIASIDWEQSEYRRKTIESGQPYGDSKPFIREWWM